MTGLPPPDAPQPAQAQGGPVGRGVAFAAPMTDQLLTAPHQWKHNVGRQDGNDSVRHPFPKAELIPRCVPDTIKKKNLK